MSKFSVSQAAKMTYTNKDTLRYYDKLKIVSPARGENGYRYYSQQDIMTLKRIKLLKCTDFSLSEINLFIKAITNGTGSMAAWKMLEQKVEQTEQKIAHLQSIVEMMKVSVEVLHENRPQPDNDAYVCEIFESIHREKKQNSLEETV